MSTPSIPGVDREDLADAIRRATITDNWLAAYHAADAVLAYIAAHHECACDREHADEWVEVDEGTWDALPKGARLQAVAAAVLYLHRPVEVEPSETICGHCSWQLPNGRFFGKVTEWPCPTVALLNPTEGETDE